MAYVAGFWVDGHASEQRIWARRRWVSAAAGVSVAYVFLDLLPELADPNAAIVHAAGNESMMFAEQRVYMLALLSFVVLYGLQYLVLASRESRGKDWSKGEIDALYLLHLAGFAFTAD